MLLSNKVIIVTGSTTGIGKAIAAQCVEEGAKVVVHGRDSKRARQVADELKGEAIACTADLGHPESATQLVQAAISHFGRLDALVNNAALTTRSRIETTTPELFDEIIAVNLRAPLLLIKEALPHFRELKQGVVVNIGSVNAYCGEGSLLAYSVSKGGLMTLTRNLADAHAHEHIRFNQLNVGWTYTDNEHSLQLKAGLPSDWHKRIPPMYAPTGRLLQPKEVASHVVFWISDASKPITGCVCDLEQYPIIGRNMPKSV